MRQDLIAILALAIFVVACDDRPAATTGPPSDLRPLSVRIDGPAQVTPPADVQFTAVQTWTDGSTRDVTASAQWTSTNPSVLSVSAGLAKALAAGEVGLLAQVERIASQPKSVRVVPTTPEWDGSYTLTVGGGACNTSIPVSPELRQRTYTALVRQTGLLLNVSVSNMGEFGGWIFNPQVRFYFSGALPLAHRVERTTAMGASPGAIRLVSYRRAAYSGPVGLNERLPNGNRLVITGEAVTTMSPTGFAGTLNGALSQFDARGTLIAGCPSASHAFTLIRN